MSSQCLASSSDSPSTDTPRVFDLSSVYSSFALNPETYFKEHYILYSEIVKLLFHALEQRNTEIFKKILNNCKPDRKGFTCLTQQQHNDLFSEVFQKRTLLQKAFIQKDFELFKYLLSQGSDLYLIPAGGNSIFHLSIYDDVMCQRLLDYVSLLLSENKIPEIPESCSKVLHYAVFEKKFNCLKILLSESSPFKRFINTDVMNVTPVHVAIGEGQDQALKILIDAGASVTIAVQDDKILPIHVAAAKGSLPCWNLLVSQLQKIFVDPPLAFRNQFSLLSLCDLSNYVVNQTASTIMTPKQFASFRGNGGVLEELLKITTKDIDYQSKSGMTALHYAVSEGHATCARTLLNHFANPLICDRNENTAFVYASFKNRYSCYVVLMNYLSRFSTLSGFNLISGFSFLSDPLYHKRLCLFLSIINTTKIQVVQVKRDPELEDVIQDLKNAIEKTNENATEVNSGQIQWKKHTLLHLSYSLMNESETTTLTIPLEDSIIKGSGITRDYLIKAVYQLFHSYPFCVNPYTHQICLYYYSPEIASLYPSIPSLENIYQRLHLAGYLLAFCFLYNPIKLSLSDCFYKTITGENYETQDFMSKEILQQITKIQTSKESKTSFQLTYSTTVPVDKRIPHELFFGKQDEMVNDDNFESYCSLFIHAHSFGGHRSLFLSHFANGFYSLIPQSFLCTISPIVQESFGNSFYPEKRTLLSYKDLKQILQPKMIHLEEWKRFTQYKNCNRDTLQVQWFWQLMEGSDSSFHSQVWEFVSGSCNLPVGGFAYLSADKIPFTITLSSSSSKSVYPTSFTCFYSLTLPSLNDQNLFNDSFVDAILTTKTIDLKQTKDESSCRENTEQEINLPTTSDLMI